MEKEKIFIAGGSGFIGTKLKKFWESNDYEVIVLSRSANPSLNRIAYPESTEDFAKLISGSKALVNLAGASIAGKRWTPDYKKELYDSRIDITKACTNAILKSEVPPTIFISASAIGIYGDRADETLTESSALEDGFIADLCKDWEKEAEPAKNKTTVFQPRIGVVLEKGFGALEKMELPFRLFVGGPVGSGTQWFSWIDIDDIVSIFDWAINNKPEGIFNVASPNPVKMKDFAKALGEALRRPSLFPVPEFVLKIVLGESAQEVVRSQKVLPERLIEEGYIFKYEKVDKSLKKIYKS